MAVTKVEGINRKYRIIDRISLVLLCICFILPLIFYSRLPEQIPIHFNVNGQADELAEKSALWMIPILGIMLYLGSFLLVEVIGRKGAGKGIVQTRKTVGILNLLISVSFCYITVQIVLTALGISAGLGSWFIYVFVFSMVLFPLLVFIETKDKASDRG